MAKKSVGRLASLDIFRGMTVAFMIIVNNPGSWDHVYPPLRHSEWHGCTPTDLVFPFFLFIVGASMWFSLKKYDHELDGKALLRILRRVVTIFVLGLFLTIFPYFSRDYTHLRIMGVLQRIALAYGLGAVICTTVRKDYLWIVVAVILLIYWGLLAFFGGNSPYSLEGNFVLKIDLALLGKNHLYTGFGIPFEPEGLLSTLPSICTVIIGYYAGDIVGKGKSKLNPVLKMLLIGTALTGLGLIWKYYFPINKPLWTSSYVLYTGGIAMAILAFLYWIADLIKFRKWGTFFEVFGTNAIFAYFLAGIWIELILYIHVNSAGAKISIYSWFYEKICVPVAGNINGSLMFAIIQMMLIWLAALVLYRKKIMIRL